MSYDNNVKSLKQLSEESEVQTKQFMQLSKESLELSRKAQEDFTKITKTIYNWQAKSKEQREEILILETDEFLRKNPEYEYLSYSTKNGKHGEHNITFFFKRKETKTA